MNTRVSKASRLQALITVCLYCISLSYAPAAVYAASPQGVQVSAEPLSAQTLPHFSLPAKLGQVEDIYQGKDERLVLLVQDAHAVPSAQKAIQEMLSYFNEEKGIRLTLLEGVVSHLDPLLFRAFPERVILNKVFEAYRDQGELSGASLAAVLGSDGMHYAGMEDAALYEKQQLAFTLAVTEQADRTQTLASFETEIAELKKTVYSKELLALDEKTGKFYQNANGGLAELMDFFAAQQTIRPNQQRLPHFWALFSEWLETKDPLAAPADLENELKELYKKLEAVSSNKEARMALHRQYQDYRTEKLTVGAFAAGLIQHLKPLEIQGLSPALITLAHRAESLRSMKGELLYQEVEIYVEELKEKMFSGEEAKSVNTMDQQLRQLQKLSEFKLSRRDWTILNQDNVILKKSGNLSSPPLRGGKDGYVRITDGDLSSPPVFSGDLASHSSVLVRVQQNVKALQAQWLAQKHPLTEFYNIAEAREQIFDKRVINTLRDRDQKTAVVVAGGFHTAGLAQALREKGISYVVITPAIGDVPVENLYQRAMLGEVSWADHFKIKNGRIDLYSAFSQATAEKLTAELPAAEKGFILKNWRDEVLRQLAAEGNLSDAARYLAFIDRATQVTGVASEEKNQTAWLAKVGRFIEGLKLLRDENKITPMALSSLLRAQTATPAVVNPLDRMLFLSQRVRSMAQAASEVRNAVKVSRPTRPSVSDATARPLDKRSEVRAVKSLLLGVHDYEGDPNDVSQRTYYPDWWVMQLLAQEMISKVNTGASAVKTQDIQEAVLSRIKGHGFKGERYSGEKLKQLLDRMADEYGMLERIDTEAYGLKEDAQSIMIRANDVGHIKTMFESAIQSVRGKKKNASKDLRVLLTGFAETIKAWDLYSVEAAWPILKAISTLSREDREILTGFLARRSNSALLTIPLIDSIRFLLTNTATTDWLKTFAPSLVGSAIYYISPETWLAAGGLGRVGQYHTLATKILMEENAQLVTIEPQYSHRVKLSIEPEGSFKETAEKSVDYEKLPISVKNLQLWKEFDVYVSKNGKRTRVTVQVSRGVNEHGIQVYLYKDKPEQEGGDSHFTKVLYGYKNPKNEMFKDAVDRDEFSEFAAKVSLIVARKIEFEKQRDGQTKTAPLLWANDGQTALLPLFKLISDDLEKMSARERRQVLSDPNHAYYEYRDLIQQADDVSLLEAVVLQTTHTYRNRVISGPKELIENLSLPKRYQGYLESGEWLYLGDPDYRNAKDATSAGVRAAFADMGGANGVASIHAQEMNPLDTGVPLRAHTNGDTRKATRVEIETIFAQPDFKAQFPNEDSEDPSLAALVEAKKRAKSHLKVNEALIALNARFADLDIEQMVSVYTGRGVAEKVGLLRAHAKDNIRQFVRNGGQLILLANVQPGNTESKEIYAALHELENELYAEREAALASGKTFGLFLVATGWSIPEQRVVLAAADVQNNDSDRDQKRGTEAAGVTETDVMAAFGLELTSPFLEAIFQQQGVVLNWEISGSGNTIIPESSEPSAYLDAMLKALEVYQTDRLHFATFQAASNRLSQILEAYHNGAAYLRALHQLKTQKNDPEFLWQSYFLAVADPAQTEAVWWKDSIRRRFDRLWEKFTRDEKQDEDLISAIPFNLEDAQKLFDVNAAGFGWWKSLTQMLSPSDPGLIGMLDTFFRYKKNNPKDLYESLRHHSKRGDFFAFIVPILEGIPSAEPVLNEMVRLREQALGESDENEKIKINLQALKLVNRTIQHMVKMTLESYVERSGQDLAVDAETLSPLGLQYQAIFNNVQFNKRAAQALEVGGAVEWDLDKQGVRAFVISRDSQEELVLLNTGEVTYPDEKGERKARTKILYSGAFEAWIEQFLPNETDGMQVLEPRRQREYRFYSRKQLELGIPVGVAGIQILRMNIESHPTLADIPVQAQTYSWENMREKIEKIKELALAGDREALMRELPANRSIALANYSEDLLPAIMTLVTGLYRKDPLAILDHIKTWDLDHYQNLKQTIEKNLTVIQTGDLMFHSPSLQGVYTFSYSVEGGKHNQNLIFHAHLNQETVSYTDQKGWVVVRNLSSESQQGLTLEPQAVYGIHDFLEDRDFNPKTGAQLARHWDVGSTVRTTYYKKNVLQRRIGSGVYQLRAFEPEDFRSPEVTVARPAQVQPANELQVFEFNVRAYFNEQGIQSFNDFSDDKLRAIAALGFNTLWPMGIYETSPASQELNEYWGKRRQQSGRVASSFAIPDYDVNNQDLGGQAGFERFVERAKTAGIRVIVDFIPNHVARDSRLVKAHPEWFVHKSTPPTETEREGYFEVTLPNGNIIWVAHATDGSMPWADTAQFNLLNPGVWQFFKTRLFKLAELTQGGGVRIDSLQVLKLDVYRSQWFPYMSPSDFENHMRAIAELVFQKPPHEGANPFGALLDTVREAYPDFKTIGEVYHEQHGYWQRSGVDITYGKYVYNWIVLGEDGGWQEFKNFVLSRGLHAGTSLDYLLRSYYFLEDHDQRIRILEKLRQRLGKPEIDGDVISRSKLLATAIATIPGVPMIYMGQESGASRYASSPDWIPTRETLTTVPDTEIEGLSDFYRGLFNLSQKPIFRHGGKPEEIPTSGGNESLIAFVRRYQGEAGVVVLNHSSQPLTVQLDLSLIGQGQVSKELGPWETFLQILPDNSSARSEVREPSFERTALEKELRPYVEDLQRGDDFSRRQPNVFLALGNPNLKVFLEFAKIWQARYVGTPIVLAGGRGRGTVPLIQAVLAHYGARLNSVDRATLQQGLTDETVKETDVMKMIFMQERVGPTFVESQPSSKTDQNFQYSAPTLAHVLTDVRAPVIAVVTAPWLLKRVKVTGLAEFAKVRHQDWQVKSFAAFQVDVEAMSDQELVDFVSYVAGYPDFYVDQYPSLARWSERNEYKGYYDVQGLMMPSYNLERLKTVQEAFEAFLKMNSASYNETLKKLELPRSELRQIVSPIVASLAEGTTVEPSSIALFAAALNRQFGSTLEAFQVEAQQPNYFSKFGTDGASTARSVENYLALEQAITQFSSQSPQIFAEAIESYLASSDKHQMHFSWIMPFDPAAAEWLKALIETVAHLSNQVAYQGRVSVNAALLVSESDRARYPDRLAALGKTAGVEVIQRNAPGAAKRVNDFLNSHKNAVAFDLDAGLKRNILLNQHFRLVAITGLSWRKAFPISAAMLFKTAQEIKITAETLRKMPGEFSGGLSFNAASGQLVINALAERFVLEASVARVLATMA